MAKFCTQCGRPLADGEVCQCQKKATNGENVQNYENTEKSVQKDKNGNGEYSVTVSTEDWVPLRKLIGIGEADSNDIEGCFERNKQIVPDLIAPCEQEVPIKQYHICNARSRIRGLWQEGKIQVTNKRILFRLSGRSWIGKAMSHTEFTIDEVAGVSLSNGVRFSIVDFIIGLLFSMVTFRIGMFFGGMPAFLAYVLAILLLAPYFILKKKYYIKALCTSVGIGILSSSVPRLVLDHMFWAKVGIGLQIIFLIIYIAALFLFALKPSLSISVMTKCASDKPIYIWSRQTMVSVMEVLPGEDAEEAIEELGSMIMDIQKLGDFGIQKWKEE